MRRAARTDANQPEIVRALRDAHCSVQILAAVGQGVPDLLVGRGARNYLLEIKIRGGKLTPDQVAWHREWRGCAQIVRTPSEALAAVGLWSAAASVAI